MAGCLRTVVAVLLLVCFISQTYCQLNEPVKVLNQADEQKYPDCGSLLKAGYNVSGVYRLTLGGNDVQISCEFVDGKASTLILRRVNGDLNFNQTWQAYVNGFGHPAFNYWGGLAVIYILNLQGQTKLYITMQDCSNVTINLSYQVFFLGPPKTKYMLHIGGYIGPRGLDDLSYNNGMPFSTYDAYGPRRCALHIRAGWWYNDDGSGCTGALPTGHYYNGCWYKPPGRYYDGIFWTGWHGFNYSLKYISMTLST